MAKFAAKDSNKNITLSPHGTGKVVVGTGATDATVQSDGNHNLVLQTGNSTTGSISITDGADGNIAITPNGTGEVDISKVDIDGGAIDGTTIGGTTPAAGAFTTAQADTVRPTTTNGTLNLRGDSSGSATTSGIGIDSSGVTVITGDNGSSASSGQTIELLFSGTGGKDAGNSSSTELALRMAANSHSGGGAETAVLFQNNHSDSTNKVVSKISATHDGSNRGGNIRFYTNPDGTANTLTQRMNISQDGIVQVEGTLKADTISEKTSATGVTVDGTLIKDNAIKPASGQSLVLQEDGGSAALTIDTSGNTTLAGTANNIGTVTSGTYNGTIGASATNNLQDYVFVTLPSNQSVSHATITAINLTSETDPNGWFDTTTFKFQPDVAGKYFISLTATGSSGTSAGYLEEIKIAVKKNDNSANYTGAVLTARVNEQSARGYVEAVCAAGIVDMNGSSDYLYNVVYGQLYFGSGTLDLYQDSVHFSAIRIGA